MTSVVKSWPRQPEPVLTDVQLTVPGGTVARVLGENGTGKTTLLRIAAGLLLPDEGSVSLAGLDPERAWSAYQRRIGFLSAGSTGLYARLSGRQHLNFWSRLSMMDRARRSAAIDRAVDEFALTAFADRRVDRISLGQRQRVRLALTFLHEPDLVLLDEPAASLDRAGVGVLAGAIEALRARSGSAIWCTPASSTGELPFDATYTVGDGRLRAVGA